jgi:ferredoxin
MVDRGLVSKALLSWRNNRSSRDPLKRVITNNQGEDAKNTFSSMLGKIPTGAVRAEPMVADDPVAMSNHIKKVARFLGADLVGIGASHPSYFYAGGRFLEDATVHDSGMQDSEELARRYPYLIAVPIALDYDLIQAHRHALGDLAYGIADQKIALVLDSLERYIHELGYQAVRGAVVPQAGALAAGLGELGRNGLVITKDYGARIVLSSIISTDLPLMADKPPDLGVEDFCKICRKCAVTCPTNSISFDDKVVWNGVEKYKINWESCYKLRPYVVEHWAICLTCITVCPYTKPKTWWRDLALWGLRQTPIPIRPLTVRILKWIDDRVWGTIANKRVRWLGYDSGVKPGESRCTIPGCTASHGQDDLNSVEGVKIELSKKPDKSKIGYYAPLKENTNRFVKRG